MKNSFLKRRLVWIYEWLYDKKRWIILHTKYHLRIMDYRATLKYIERNRCNVARFGDGEFGYFWGLQDTGFQERSDKLCERLKEVLVDKNPHLLICIPKCFVTLHGCNKRAKTYWKGWYWQGNKQEQVLKYIKSVSGKYRYGDAQFTRPYIDWKGNVRAEWTYGFLRQFWMGKNILIVEGEQTRMGIGNDLLSTSESIQRILVPAIGAFRVYEEIKNEIIKRASDRVVLLALGPTATILAADLAHSGIWAIDIGHLDIEYEWYKMAAQDKSIVKGKFVQEVKGGKVVDECTDPDYLSQIVCRIGI